MVGLSCAISSSNTVTNPPVCVVSPDANITPPATPSLTITTCGGTTGTSSGVPCTGATPPGIYTITITGTDGGTTVIATTAINVVDVQEDYTLSALPTTATPSPVTAGQSATSTITISPIGDYTGNVALSCISVSPAVAAAPYCTFTYPVSSNGNPFVAVSPGSPGTVTLTIVTLGPIQTVTENFPVPHAFYSLWLAFPGIAVVAGLGNRKRRRGLLRFWMLLTIAVSLLLLPACGTTDTNNPQNLVTPKNTYVFTLSATDSSGTGPANSTTSPATVSVQVN